MLLVEDHVAISAPPGVPVWDVDPYAEEILLSPQSYYEELRAKGPLVYLSKYSVLASGRYAQTKEVFSDWKRFVSSRGVGLSDFKHAENWRAPSIVLEADPPAHTRARTVISRALSPGAVANLKAQFQDAAERLVNSLLDREPFDGVQEIAEALPLAVFPSAVGLREINRRALLDYGAMVFNLLGPHNALHRHWFEKATEVVPWINAHCSREKLLPEGFGASIYAGADAGEISEHEAALLVRSLLSAGIDTTVTGIGNALWCLANHPEEFAKLKENPALARTAVEEVLRYTSPVHSFYRTAQLDTQVAGVDISADTKILCVLGSANRDPLKWPEADRFDINRRPVGHLAFGAGVHGCVGQIVARAETEAVLAAIAIKVDAIELAGEARWRPGNAIHGLDYLPLRFARRA